MHALKTIQGFQKYMNYIYLNSSVLEFKVKNRIIRIKNNNNKVQSKAFYLAIKLTENGCEIKHPKAMQQFECNHTGN